MQPRLEERGRIGVHLGLHVLRQADERGAAVSGVEHRLDGERQRLSHLLWPDNAIPVARDGPERIVDRDGRRAEVLDLLQHGIGDPALEGVAGEDQDRQAVGVRQPRRRDHVRRTRPDGRGRDHDLPAPSRLREGNSRMCHSLLALPTVRRQDIPHLFECTAEAGHVAVPEDREHSWEQRHLDAVDDRALGDQEPDDRLRGCQLDGLHSLAPAAVVIGHRGSGA